MTNPTPLPELGLYVHVPWCVRKCPYCDFNSHGLQANQKVPEADYLKALIADLQNELGQLQGRMISSIFFGGGTPSLLSTSAVEQILGAFHQHLEITADCEITLEANPGALSPEKALGFRQAGINRISIGAQSFSQQKLESLGRIHSPAETHQASRAVRDANYRSHNLDLMYALPQQTPSEALDDLRQALALAPPHLSLYQLTLEPNTPFYANPPTLPDEENMAEMEQALLTALIQAGYERYEVSAYARPGERCQHNLNYWQFGDYLGIGPGAHGKITTDSGVIRRVKHRHPKRWLRASTDSSFISSERTLLKDDLIFEFMLNALRLTDGVSLALFEQRTGVPRHVINDTLQKTVEEGLLADQPEQLVATPLGQRFLNDLTSRFLPTAA